MSGTSRRNKLYEALPAPVVAYMIDQRLLTGWPLEVTQRGLAYLQRFPTQNVHRRALEGDATAFDTYLIKGRVSSLGQGTTPEGVPPPALHQVSRA